MRRFGVPNEIRFVPLVTKSLGLYKLAARINVAMVPLSVHVCNFRVPLAFRWVGVSRLRGNGGFRSMLRSMVHLDISRNGIKTEEVAD